MEGQIICIIYIVALISLNYIIYFGYTKNKYFDPTNKNFDPIIENKN